MIVPSDERLRLCRRILLNRLMSLGMAGDVAAASTYLRNVGGEGDDLMYNADSNMSDAELIAACKRVGIHMAVEEITDDPPTTDA